MKTHKEIYLGAQKLATSFDEVSGTEVKIEGETFYKIANYDAMRPFFMSIVSNSNQPRGTRRKGPRTGRDRPRCPKPPSVRTLQRPSTHPHTSFRGHGWKRRIPGAILASEGFSGRRAAHANVRESRNGSETNPGIRGCGC